MLVFHSPSTRHLLARMKSPLSQKLSLQSFVAGQPARLIGDKAYDSDQLDAELAGRGIELIAPLGCIRILLRCYL